jgi:prepilin-type processing-associated H-X9-DG protein
MRNLLREGAWTTPPPSLPLHPSDLAMISRHGGPWNMALCDGHVEGGKLRKFYNLNDENVARRWSRDNRVTIP